MRYDYREVMYERQRALQRPAPRRYGARPVSAGPLRTGECPICWAEVELNLAGRIRPHTQEPMLHPCDGIGSFPRTNSLERLIHTDNPQRLHWWRNPTCQVCHALLADDDGNPSWDVTPGVTFVCRNNCRREGHQ